MSGMGGGNGETLIVEGSMGNSLGQVTFNVDEAYVHPR